MNLEVSKTSKSTLEVVKLILLITIKIVSERILIRFQWALTKKKYINITSKSVKEVTTSQFLGKGNNK